MLKRGLGIPLGILVGHTLFYSFYAKNKKLGIPFQQVLNRVLDKRLLSACVIKLFLSLFGYG